MKTTIKLVRALKRNFFRFKLHQIIPGKNFIFLGHLSELSRWIRQQKDIQFTDFPTSKFEYEKRYKLHQFVIDSQRLDEIDYLEFGVAAGSSFKWWVEKITNANSRFYGFDTFTGLPEDWGPFKKGAMSNGNKPPEIKGSRHQFYQGVFQKTLFDFLKSYQSNKRKVIHLDADLYSATLFVLTSITPYLNKGDILLFDEFNVPLHEYKAFKEWSESFYIDYRVLGEVNNFYQTAIVIE